MGEEIWKQSEGKVDAFIVSVGGFLGVGEKDVAVPFSALHPTNKDNTNRLVLDTTKDALKGAPGYKYDRTTTTWINSPAVSSVSSPM